MSRADGNPTSIIYRAVIDDVVTRVKPEFVQEGVNECACCLHIALVTNADLFTGLRADSSPAISQVRAR